MPRRSESVNTQTLCPSACREDRSPRRRKIHLHLSRLPSFPSQCGDDCGNFQRNVIKKLQVMAARSGDDLIGTQSTTLLGVKISQYSRPFQIVFCSTSIFIAFLLNGICEEYVFRKLQFSYAWYFTLVQCSVYVVLAYLQGGWQMKVNTPWKAFLILAFVWVGSVGLTKGSLRYINYPAQIMFKSSKIIPVMIMGAFIPGLKRTYSLPEYLSALALTVGLIVFTLADVSVTPSFEVIGLVMIIGALIFDAFLGNLQEALFISNPSISQEKVLFCTNLLSIPFLFVPLIATGEVWSAWNNGLEYPKVYVIIGSAAVATYIGQLAILALIALFGAAAAYMVTSLRKAFTLCLSYFIFTKPLNTDHLVGIILIFVSISMKLCLNPKKKESGPPVERGTEESVNLNAALDESENNI